MSLKRNKKDGFKRGKQRYKCKSCEHVISKGLGKKLSESGKFGELKGMNWDIVNKLSDNGLGDIVLNNFSQFPKEEFFMSIPKLVGKSTDFLLNKIPNLFLNDKQKLFILQRLINNGDGGKLLYDDHLDSFKGLQEDIVDLMLEKGDKPNIITYMLDFTELSKEFFLERYEQIGVSEEYINNKFAGEKK